MPRRNLLTPAEHTGLLAFPATDDELIQHYTFAEPDLSVIRQRRGSHNRLGFAVQLCYLRYGVEQAVVSPAATSEEDQYVVPFFDDKQRIGRFVTY